MKKLISIFLSISIVLSVAVAFAADGITVTVDGSEIEFDTPPIIENNVTLVPMRAIFETLGAEVEWNGQFMEVIARKDDTVITLFIDLAVMYIDTDTSSELRTLDYPPIIVNDRTLVPLRAVSEAFDCEVLWDGDAKTVTILSGSED